ncbi:unnamed protein product [Linum tenue]|uniref:Uncharacterized protein n=1 Tax=Linum tenue TaxID=586396 RepID=A0AAV0S8R6_9ROSI|nr:unnamed protein product [Linum tenue]
MIQNHPRTDPDTKPIPRNTIITIAASSASEPGTDFGARIIRTLVRYPFVTPSMNVRTTTGTSDLSHLVGPWRQAANKG